MTIEETVLSLDVKKVTINVIAKHSDLIPSFASSGAAGSDVRANIENDVVIPSGEIRLIPTGLIFEIPEGVEIQIRSRSGLALKHGVTVLNSPGTIDSDYRGEVSVILINHSKTDFIVTPKMRIAQLVVAKILPCQYVQVASVNSTNRGSGGFGHTGFC